MIYINGRPKNKPDIPRKKKRIKKTSHVRVHGVNYLDVTNIFTYSAEWESDKEYCDVMTALQGMREKYL